MPAAAIIATMGAICAYTFILLGRVCATTDADSYEQSWGKTVGEKSAWLPAGSCVATCFAGCLAYTIIIGDSFSALAKTFGAPAMVANRSNIIVAMSAAVLLPLSLLKSEIIVVDVEYSCYCVQNFRTLVAGDGLSHDKSRSTSLFCSRMVMLKRFGEVSSPFMLMS